MTGGKSGKTKAGAMHASSTVDKNWLLRKGSHRAPVKVERTRCPLFSDGKHRFMVTPAGLRVACMCGATS